MRLPRQVLHPSISTLANKKEIKTVLQKRDDANAQKSEGSDWHASDCLPYFEEYPHET